MTSQPPPAPRTGRHSQPSRMLGITRIVQTDELPDGVNALASADGKTIIVRASLDAFSRRSAMREVMTTIRRFPRLALYPAVAAESIRQLLRRMSGAVSGAGQAVQQVVATAGDHLGGVAVAVTAAAGTAIAVTAAVGASPPARHPVPGSSSPPAARAAGPSPVRAVHARLSAKPLSRLGVFGDGPGFAPVEQFAAATHHQPNVVLYYSSWYEKFQAGFADQISASGAVPLVQINPFGVSLADIAAGRYDGYLISYADQVRSFGRSVIIGFAHEPNGNWYPWGQGKASPASFIGAWRHIVDVFRAQGADNVTWLWTVNSMGNGVGPIAGLWPGAAYVTWVGIDGYYVRPGDTFASVFGPTITAVRQLTSDQILISETAVGPATGDQPGKITDLFAGVRAQHLLGLVWFDKSQDKGPYRQDWRLEGDPAAITAFRRGADYLPGS
jgi:mannan endo-1,4-beta-mannosidase